MSTYCNQLQPALQNLLQHVVQFFHLRSSCMTHISVDVFGGRKSLKASDAAENLQLYRVVWFFHPRSSCTTRHISADVQRITLNASCMTISRVEQPNNSIYSATSLDLRVILQLSFCVPVKVVPVLVGTSEALNKGVCNIKFGCSNQSS